MYGNSYQIKIIVISSNTHQTAVWRLRLRVPGSVLNKLKHKTVITKMGRHINVNMKNLINKIFVKISQKHPGWAANSENLCIKKKKKQA